MRMDIRAFGLEVRQMGDEGTFTGYASVFGNVDSYGTVFDKGAFKKTINDNGGAFPITWFHDPTTPIGMATLREDGHGLLVDGQLNLDVSAGHDVYSGMKAGYVDRMSHGFDVVTTAIEKDITHFKEVRLYEVALVTRNFASNDQALVTDVRSMSMGVRRVSEAILGGAEADLRKAVADLRLLLMNFDDPQDEVLEDVRGLHALLTEGPTIVTPTVEEPHQIPEPREHSEELLGELRKLGETLQITR